VPIKDSEAFYYREFNDNGKRERKVAWSSSVWSWSITYHTIEDGWRPVKIRAQEVMIDGVRVGYVIVAVEEREDKQRRVVLYDNEIKIFQPVKQTGVIDGQ